MLTCENIAYGEHETYLTADCDEETMKQSHDTVGHRRLLLLAVLLAGILGAAADAHGCAGSIEIGPLRQIR